MIRFILNIYLFIVIIDAILSYLPQFRNHEIVVMIRKAANLTLDPIRRLLPKDLPVDISPIILIIGINLLKALW